MRIITWIKLLPNSPRSFYVRPRAEPTLKRNIQRREMVIRMIVAHGKSTIYVTDIRFATNFYRMYRLGSCPVRSVSRIIVRLYIVYVTFNIYDAYNA